MLLGEQAHSPWELVLVSPSARVLPMVVAVGKEKMTAGVLEVPDMLADA